MELEPATCTDEGKVQYTAKVANPDKPGSTFVTFKTVKTPIDPNGHAFDVDENKWVWSDDHQSATLIKTCFFCGKEISYEAKVTKQVTKEPTASSNGEKTFTATVSLDGKTIQNRKRLL
ncbi:MAG: hypothetical protein SOS22_00280 [Absicoccus sp.]|uniref:Uncharacterized protein n=1 Tax=Absicoccus intestinalis TaxID=2926319 RepID=A0ABU4WKG8_9FIRM|nr:MULTISPECIES: hypothetical protein [unclassified Absicoccus]MDX8417061.1 hypothetical protein [Absicoccus sp. CLA-KB-P134]MDY3034640.1 hypothetical protein [Absicoccus sp.]